MGAGVHDLAVGDRVAGAETLGSYAELVCVPADIAVRAAKELAERRIRVNTLHPGPTSTPFQDDIEVRATGEDQRAAAEIFDGMIPLGRHTTPEEIARIALYLALDASAMITASTFAIDGGMSG